MRAVPKHNSLCWTLAQATTDCNFRNQGVFRGRSCALRAGITSLYQGLQDPERRKRKTGRVLVPIYKYTYIYLGYLYLIYVKNYIFELSIYETVLYMDIEASQISVEQGRASSPSPLFPHADRGRLPRSPAEHLASSKHHEKG